MGPVVVLSRLGASALCPLLDRRKDAVHVLDDDPVDDLFDKRAKTRHDVLVVQDAVEAGSPPFFAELPRPSKAVIVALDLSEHARGVRAVPQVLLPPTDL